MAPSSKPEKGKGSEVHFGTIKEVLLAFMEKLVYPLLPSNLSAFNPPDEDDQEAVAKQMHAVVLLYNYYYMRQNPEMKSVDFPSFCELAVSLTPSIASFMNLKKEGQFMMLNGDEDLLSPTEKAMQNACEIAFTLDASKDDPDDTQGWPISKVAVLLVDSKRENCMLCFGEITKGVWSLIERSIHNGIYQQSSKGNVGDKRRLRSSTTLKACSDDDELQQLAFGVIKDITGTSDLMILESHVVYSLSEEKSAVQFYIIQAPQTFAAHDQTSLEFLIASLQGPLAEKDEASWISTSVVEHYHLLPYMGIISSWFLRKDLSSSSYSYHAKNGSNGSQKAPSNENSHVKYKKPKHSSDEEVANAMNAFLLRNGDDDVSMNFLGSIDENVDENLLKTDDITLCTRRKSNQRNPSKGLPQNMIMDGDDTIEKIKERRSITSGVNFHALRSSLKESQIESNDAKNPSQQILNDMIPLEEDRTGYPQDQLQFQVITEQSVPAPEVVQIASMILSRKIQELYSQMCIKEDMLELYEQIMEKIREGSDVGLARMCIDSVLIGNKDCMLDLETQIQPQLEKQSRFSGIYIPGKSKCKDLEIMCVQNKWRLPRYCAEPSEGTKFKYSVSIVVSKTLKLTANGGLAYSPSEARESAAAQMIVETCNSCA